MATGKRPSRGVRPATRRTAGQKVRPETRIVRGAARSDTRGRRAPAPPPKKNHLPLIIAGAAGGVTLLIVIIIVATAGGSKDSPKTDKNPEENKPASTGDRVNKALLNRGLNKCERGLRQLQALENRIESRNGKSQAWKAKLAKELQAASDLLKAGFKDIEDSGGKASVRKYINAKNHASYILKELK